jgi:hypothetical protein
MIVKQDSFMNQGAKVVKNKVIFCFYIAFQAKKQLAILIKTLIQN